MSLSGAMGCVQMWCCSCRGLMVVVWRHGEGQCVLHCDVRLQYVLSGTQARHCWRRVGELGRHGAILAVCGKL